MKTFIYIFLLQLVFVSSADSDQLYRVYFSNKGIQDLGSELHSLKATGYISQKALSRRSKYLESKELNSDSLLTYRDIPVSGEYVDSLTGLGLEYKVLSSWFNYAIFNFGNDTIETTPLIKAIEKLSFVSQIESIDTLPSFGGVEQIHIDSVVDVIPRPDCETWLDYGFSESQTTLLQVEDIHRNGFFGQGVTIAVIDNGFRTNHEALKHIKVDDAYDFIQNDRVVSNQEGDVENQDHHGTPVLGVMASYAPGSLIGISPFSNFLLYKTEDMRQESKIEEEFFLAAVERAERFGADIITASLGYYKFDSSYTSHDSTVFDGLSAPPSRAYSIAASLGVVCISSAGNNGGDPKTIGSPADAIGAVAVGALNPNHSQPASFSSFGPTSDGRAKPEIFAQGINVATISPSNPEQIIYVNGTSFSAPNIAGCFALLRSQYPSLAADELIRIFLANTSDLRFGPDSLGYPLLSNSITSLKPITSVPMYYDLEQNGFTYRRFYTVVEYMSHQRDRIDIFFSIKDATGENMKIKATKYFGSSIYFFDVLKSDFANSINLTVSTVVEEQEFKSLLYKYPMEAGFQEYSLCGFEDVELTAIVASPDDFFVFQDENTALGLVFKASEAQSIILNLYTRTGKKVTSVMNTGRGLDVEKGLNRLKIGPTPVASGLYYATITKQDGTLLTKSIFLR